MLANAFEELRYTSFLQPFLPKAYPVLTMSREGTPQNLALLKGAKK
jgi:hypothetical protein